MIPIKPTIFILSWNRPIYLWVCLDSIYRHTKTPCKIIIADNNSSDPLNQSVIESFDKRNLFDHILLYKENDPFRFKELIKEYWDKIDDFFVLIEGDIEILPSIDGNCWLGKMLSFMEQNKNLASIGSRVYKPDFVSFNRAAELEPNLSKKEIDFLIKTHAPMRNYNVTNELLIEPHNAPLRLMMIRKTAYEKIEFGRDTYIYNQFKSLGYDAKISTEITHRHLSLLNIFDYPDHSLNKRDNFFNRQNK